MYDCRFKTPEIRFLLVIAMLLMSNSAIAQVEGSLLLTDKPIKTKDFKFEPTYFVLSERGDGNLPKPYNYMLRKLALPYNVDLSFLKDYDYKKYNAGDFITNLNLIDTPFKEWGTDVIPYHLKQQTFWVVKKKKNK
jgi:hypothetical protein